jgi:CubicO group peptidase (beta-lactamase class C family)
MNTKIASLTIVAVHALAACSSSPHGRSDATAIDAAADAASDAAVLDASSALDGSAGLDGAVVDTGPPEDSPITARFMPLVDAVHAEMAQLGAPGVAVLVLEHGQVTFAHGFGTKDPAGGDPVHATTLFRIGSVTKMLTTCGLLQFVANGQLNLDHPITEPLPDFNFATNAMWAPSIELKHLLTHASGIVDYLTIDVPAAEKTDAALSSFLTGDFTRLAYLMDPAGSMWNYSNPNFMLAGLILERKAGQSYRQAMRDRVFAPLGMDRTFFLASEVLADGDFAKGKSSTATTTPTIDPSSYDNPWARPAGYAWSSVYDLAKFVLFLSRGNDAVLPTSLRMAMQSPQIDTDLYLHLVSYGYALEVWGGVSLGRSFYHTTVVTHGGDIPGYAADVYYLPESDFGFISLASADAAHFLNSFVVGALTLATLTSSSAPPVANLDPSTFDQFAGVYQDDFNVGRIVVAKVGNTLTATIPALATHSIPYEHLLVPLVDDNFALTIEGQELDVTFIRDAQGHPAYFRTRPFVGRRVSMFQSHESLSAQTFDPQRFRALLRASRAPDRFRALSRVPGAIQR